MYLKNPIKKKKKNPTKKIRLYSRNLIKQLNSYSQRLLVSWYNGVTDIVLNSKYTAQEAGSFSSLWIPAVALLKFHGKLGIREPILDFLNYKNRKNTKYKKKGLPYLC